MDLVLIGLIAATALFSYQGFNDRNFKNKYIFSIDAIKKGQQYRMISSGFLHADAMHLIFNMLTLYFFAPVVTHFFGSGKFLLIYFASLICGSILSFLFHKNEPYYTALGASGAVTGVLYSAILLQPNMPIYLFFIPIGIPAYIFGIFYLGFSIYGMKKQLGNVGHTAHFGGAVGGYLFTLLMMPELLETNFWIVVLLAIPMLVLFILDRSGKM